MLDKIVSPEWAALLVVDVQNDFCHPDGLFGKLGMDMSGVQRAARRISALLPEARACVEGTWGAELYVVQPAPGEPVVRKHRYSPFVGTNIDYVLRAKQRKSLLVTGVATNICVESVLRDGFMRDYHVVLVEDCTGAYSERAHQSTVENTRAFLGRVVQSEMLRSEWSKRG